MLPQKPIVLDSVLDDPAEAMALLRRHAPYELLQGRTQVMASAVEQAAITGGPVPSSPSLALTPTFRGYWALGEPLVDGVEWLLHLPRLVDAARRLHGAEIVRPTEIYAHVVCPGTPTRSGAHVDIPNFRGMGRRDYPTWLLVTMRRSGLFDRWHVPVATCVMWFYDGPGGRYVYWPEGPDGAPVVTTPPYTNTAVVGENDTMLHRGEAPPGEPVSGLTTTSRLRCEDDGTWAIVDGDGVLATYAQPEVRFAISWSAMVLADERAAAVLDDHSDDLDLATVVDVFCDDLARRGLPADRPPDPLHGEDWVRLLGDTYRVVPATQPT